MSDNLPPGFKSMTDESMPSGFISIDALGDVQQPTPQVRPERPSPLVRFGRGFADYTQGIEQIARQATGSDPELFTREKTQELQNYEAGRGPDAGIDIMRIVGNAVAAAPTMAIPGAAAPTIRARLLAGAAGGAAGSGLQFMPEGESRIPPTMLGAGLGAAVGAAAPYAVEGIKRGARAVWERLAGQKVSQRAFDIADDAISKAEVNATAIDANDRGLSWNMFRKEIAAEVDDALKAGTALTDEQVQRLVEMRAVGANPMKANITRTPEDWATMENLRGMPKTGAPINRRIVDNANALVRYTEAFRNGLGGKASTAYEAGSSVLEAVQKKSAEMQREVGDLYKQIRVSTGNALGLQPNKMISVIDEISDDAAADPLVDSVRRRLRRFELIDKEGVPTGKAISVKDAEELRKWIGGLSSKEPAVKRLKSMVIDALDDDVIDTAGQDSFKTARDAARKRFQEFEQGVLGKAVNNELSPDDFVKKHVMSAKVDDLRAMKKTLTSGTGEQMQRGTQAWNDARGFVVTDLLMKATGATSPEDVAGRMFSGAKFKRALDALGTEKKAILFSPEEMAALRTLVRASENLTTSVPASAWNTSRSGSIVIEYLSNAMSKIPMLASMFGGGLTGAAAGAATAMGSKAVASRQGARALAQQLGGLPTVGPRVLRPGRGSRALPGALSGGLTTYMQDDGEQQ